MQHDESELSAVRRASAAWGQIGYTERDDVFVERLSNITVVQFSRVIFCAQRKKNQICLTNYEKLCTNEPLSH